MSDLIGLEQPTLNALMTYLTQRPYKEVHALIKEIETTAKVIKVDEVEATEDE
jgi:hypothetical protein